MLMKEAADNTVHSNAGELARFRAAMARAEELERRALFAEAGQIYRDLMNDHPGHPALLHNLALTLRARGDLAQAETLIRNAIVADPGDAAIHNSLGVLLKARGDARGAEVAFREATAVDERYPDAYYNLGLLLEEQQRYQEALDAYMGALNLQRANARVLTRIGALLKDRGTMADALSYLQRAVAAEPDYFDAHYYRGWALSKARRYDEALSALRLATGLKPDSYEALQSLANTLRDAQRYDEALAAYWQLLEKRPDDASLHSELNQLAWSSGRHDLYLRSFAYARERLGDVPGLMALEAHFYLRRDDFARAEPLLRRAYQLAPERGDIAGALARTVAGQGRYEECYPYFLAAMRAEPLEMRHRQELGFTMLRHWLPREALIIFEQGLTLNPFDQLLLAGISLAYRQLGDSRYQKLVDFSRYMRIYDIKPPKGFADTEAFNAALAQELDSLHTLRFEPIDQTLRGGTQTMGKLFAEKSDLIEQVRESISEAVVDYIRGLPKDAEHPASVRKPERFRFEGSWSCRLASGGHHQNHVHPQGWISSAYYARLPANLQDDKQKAGWLRFGQSNLGLEGGRDIGECFARPRVGRLVLFPSFYWHGTVPFVDQGDRLTIAFDVAPVEATPAVASDDPQSAPAPRRIAH